MSYLVTSMISYAYSILMHGRYGQTLGKMQAGVKIIDVKEDRPITYWQAVKREIVPLVVFLTVYIYKVYLFAAGKYEVQLTTQDPLQQFMSSVLWIWFLLEIITMLFSPKRRALHDLIAGTVVVVNQSLT